LLTALIIAALVGLLLYRLGSLIGGISANEQAVAQATYGWHGMYHNPLYLPLNLIRSADFFIFSHHGQTLTRLPNALFGAAAIISFGWLVRLWHGNRTAIFATALFACGAWTLHVSRLASYEVLYLWAIPTLLLANALLNATPTRKLAYYGSVCLWAVLLFIPGMVWIVAINLFWQRKLVAEGWQHFAKWWQRLLYVVIGLVWVPLVALGFSQQATITNWLGFPTRWAAPLDLLRQLALVPYHLFIRGPHNPELWLGRAPILDIFTLVACIFGIYFYVLNRTAKRSKVLASFALAGIILVAFGGPVGLSILVPLLYLFAATGIAYLTREWLKVFPVNPLARTFGISLIAIAVALSCVYNVRAYFVAWPHNPASSAVFRYHR